MKYNLLNNYFKVTLSYDIIKYVLCLMNAIKIVNILKDRSIESLLISDDIASHKDTYDINKFINIMIINTTVYNKI